MKKINYEIYDLGGNTTAIISSNLSDEKCLEVADKIMKANTDVEQVAMIISVRKNTCTFKMAGGEFCGNACRAVAEYMRKNYNVDRCSIEIDGIKIKGASNCKTSEIIIAKKDLIKRIESNGLYCVFMNGITFVVKQKIEGESNKQIAESIKQQFGKDNKIEQALGIVLIEDERIDPFVWVTKANTFFNETACLSGSIAAAMFLKQNKIGKKVIIQPTNEKYTISIGKTNIKASGKVFYIKSDNL